MTDLLGNEINVGDDAVFCRHPVHYSGNGVKMIMQHGYVKSICKKTFAVIPIDDDNDEIYYVAPSKLVDLTAYCWVV